MTEKMYELMHEMISARVHFWKMSTLPNHEAMYTAFADVLDIMEYCKLERADMLEMFEFFPEDFRED